MLTGFRRFYLYAALSVALLALSVAAVLGLGTVLGMLGVGDPPPRSEVPRTFSLVAAIALLALPLGAIHVVLVRRAEDHPRARDGAVPHAIVNVWWLVAFLAALFSGSALADGLRFDRGSQTAQQLALVIVAAVVGAVAWIWGEPRGPAGSRWRRVALSGALAIAMLQVASSLGSAASTLSTLLTEGRVLGPRPVNLPVSYFQAQLLANLVTAAWCLALWVVVFRRGAAWRAGRPWAAYLLAAYGLGVVAVLFALPRSLAGLVRYLSGTADVAAVTDAWWAIASGLLLVLVHAALLRRDRAISGSRVVVDRLLVLAPALAGLGVLSLGVGMGWQHLLARDESVTPIMSALLGGLAYVPAWRWLMRSTRDEPESAIRRFALFSIVCLALIAALIAGIVTLYNAFVAWFGAGFADSGDTALRWLGPSLLAAAIFAVHYLLLATDQRRAASAPAGVPQAPDVLRDTLAAVRDGSLTVDDAEERVRRLWSQPK